MWNNLQKFVKITPSFRFLHKYVFRMDKAYLRHPIGSPQFEITFNYKNPDLNIERQFNFSRQIEETVSTFLGRVSTNVEKILSKKAKKKKKKTEYESEASTSEPSVKIGLINNGNEVASDKNCSDIFKESNQVILKVGDYSYEIVFNSPWVDSISLPGSLMAGFPVYPLKIATQFTDMSSSDITWYKSENKQKWDEVGRGFTYTPTNQDIGSFLKLTLLPKCGTLEGPVAEIITESKVGASPGQCPFERRHAFTSYKCTGRVIRFVTYNILADLYCDSDYTRTELFPYCPPYALSIDYRIKLILKEVIGYKGDIICLQEVDKKVYHNDLVPVLSSLGYESNFALKGGMVAEGLACFFDNNRFRLLDSSAIELSKHIESQPILSEIFSAICKNEKLKERVLDRSTVLQILLLESIENKNELILVGNTHLYFHPDADHIRLLQGTMCIKIIEHLYESFSKKYVDHKISVIFCGDLNSSPDCGIYRLLTTGYVPEDFKDWKSNLEEAVEGLSIRQPFEMESACGIPLYTNFTGGFKDCLDWIYFEKKKFEIEQIIPLPSVEEMSECIALPSIVFPSDHVALISDLRLL